MTEAELLAKLRRTAPYCEPSFYNLGDDDALALLISWRDEAVQAERERVETGKDHRPIAAAYIEQLRKNKDKEIATLRAQLAEEKTLKQQLGNYLNTKLNTKQRRINELCVEIYRLETRNSKLERELAK